MKKSVAGFSYILCLIVILLSGCELSTPPLGPPRGKVVGNNLVINELFMISPDKYYAYSWLELFNPTDHYIPWLDDVFPISTYAIGVNGTLIHTDELDAGEWSVALNGNTQTYNSLDFNYPDTAFVAGKGGLVQKLRRDPSGAFTTETLVSGTTRNINDCQFKYLSAVGYLVCDGGEIRRSTNRGQVWTLQTSGVTSNLHHLEFVDFGNPARIWVVGDSGVVLRKAGGISWTKQTVPANKQTVNFYGMIMTTDTGFVVGQEGTILLTRNGGANWSSKQSGVTTTLRSAFMGEDTKFHVQGRAWVVGDGGLILRSDDYGETWRRQQSGTTARLNKVVFGDSIRGGAFGDGGVVLNTTDGGNTWHQQNSRTGENIVAANMLPLTIKVENYYVIEMIAKRKTFFFDLTTGTINFDYFTKIDTGMVVYDPQALFNAGAAERPKDIAPYAFIVLNSDSTRFKDHVKLGPGQTQTLNLSIAFQPDTVPHPVLWDLLASGEVRLVKYYVKQTTGGQPVFLGFERKVIEVLRYGDFDYTKAAAYYPENEVYPDNHPINGPGGFIPEGNSVARFANDGGGKQAVDQNSALSYYLALDPVPGWFSQESRSE